MPRGERRRRLRALLPALLVAAMGVPAAAGPYDPQLRFRTLKTAHFLLHFHQGEEQAAGRLAVIVERVHDALVPSLAPAFSGRTHVVLVDQDDEPNGTTTVIPWDAIELVGVPPTGVDTIGNADDWLLYVFTHEYAHVLHLDRSVGWARVARAVFGRTEIAFPNLSLPLWQIEGFAVVAEGAIEAGRLRAGDFREIVDAGARAGRPEPIDRVNGGLVDWPSGQGWYAYGARFDEFLIARYGRERFLALSDATAGELPFVTFEAFREVYGKSLGALWSEFESGEVAEAARRNRLRPSEPEWTRLTRLGFHVTGPRADADGGVWFSASNPHGLPGIYRLAPGGRLERKATRFGGRDLAMGRDVVIFSQLEFVRGAGLASDLYALDRHTGRVRRLTRDARLVDPDLSPDGRRLAVIRTGVARRDLLVLDAERLLASPAPVAGPNLPIASHRDAGTAIFATPRWSPDGTRLAVEWRELRGPSTIVVFDAALAQAGPLIVAPQGRAVTPSWIGERALLFASDAAKGPFAVYRATWDGDAPFADVLRLASPRGGAEWPIVDARGRLVFVGYTTEGDDLFAGPLPRSGARVDFAVQTLGPPIRPAPAEDAGAAGAAAGATAYRPWSTLLPHGWLPVVEQRDDRWRVGAQVYGADVLQRHAFAASASWAVTSGPAASTFVPGGRPDWNASYAYRRWQAEPFVAGEDRTSVFQTLDSAGALVPVAQREQQVDAGVWRPFRRVRWTQTVLGSYHAERLAIDVPGARGRTNRSGLRGSWTLVTARRYGYSISQEDGIAAAVSGEAVRPALGADGTGDAVTGDVRAYLPLGWPHAVLAVRAAGAASRGAAGARRLFRLGGDQGDAALGAFGSDAVSLLRGFDDRVFSGTHVALVNVEARVPIAWPARGVGTWPLFLRSVHATAFADLGNAWTASSTAADWKRGVGAEVSADVVAGYGLPLTWSVGVAWGHDGAGLVPDQRRVYVRVGPSF